MKRICVVEDDTAIRTELFQLLARIARMLKNTGSEK